MTIDSHWFPAGVGELYNIFRIDEFDRFDNSLQFLLYFVF